MEEGTETSAATEQVVETPAAEQELTVSAEFQQEGVEDALQGLVPQEVLDAINASKTKPTEPVKKSEAKTDPEGTEDAEEKSDDKKEGEEEPAKKSEKTTKDEPKSILGLGKKKDAKGTEIVIEKAEDILPIIKSKFGQDLKDLKELPKFFESVEKMRVSAQKAEAIEKEHNNLKTIIEGLPAEFIPAIQDFYAGKDYMKAFEGRPKFDFNKSVEKQDTKDLVNHYFPGKFTDEDFKEEQKSQALDIAITASQDKFNNEKQTRESKTAAAAERASRQLENFNKSVTGSVENLKRDFPEMDEDAFNEVKSTLEGGQHKVLSYFFNDDGTMKTEAAKMLMMAKHGEAEISRMMNIASHEAETKTNGEILTRGADQPKPKKSTPATETLPPEVQKQLAELSKFTDKKTF